MTMHLRKLARKDPDMFHFVRRWLGLRVGRDGWTACRELCRLWYHEHPDAAGACRAIPIRTR